MIPLIVINWWRRQLKQIVVALEKAIDYAEEQLISYRSHWKGNAVVHMIQCGPMNHMLLRMWVNESFVGN